MACVGSDAGAAAWKLAVGGAAGSGVLAVEGAGVGSRVRKIIAPTTTTKAAMMPSNFVFILNFSVWLSMLGLALLLKGEAASALPEIEQEKTEVWRMIGLPMAYH